LIFVTSYMGTQYSFDKTRKNASSLAEECGTRHLDINIDNMLKSFKDVVEATLKKEIKFQSQDGTYSEEYYRRYKPEFECASPTCLLISQLES
jgi:hypothetical protein